MNQKKTRVAVNGYGIIGKRVADAVRLQSDMSLVGVADVVSDYRVQAGAVLGLPVYASLPDKVGEMKDAGIPVTGTLDDLLNRVDVMVDCTPKGIGAKNLERYREAGVKAVYQGGEKHNLTGHSFVAQANYETTIGRDATRVVSCNTTSTVRTLYSEGNHNHDRHRIGDGRRCAAGFVYPECVGQTVRRDVWFGAGVMLAAATVLAIAIGLQNMPEGLAVALPPVREGCSRRRALAMRRYPVWQNRSPDCLG